MKAYINPWKLFVGSFLPNWLMERTEISQGAKMIYARLCQFAGKDGQCFPSIDILAKSIGVGERQALRGIKELVEIGLLISERRGLGKTNEYFFLLHEWMSLPDMTHVSHQEMTDMSPLKVTHKSLPIKIRESSEENHLRKLYVFVTDHLNKTTNSNYRSATPKTQELIRARANEGFTEADFKKVIDKKSAEWLGTDMEPYLRPVTLFGTKFESYLNQHGNGKASGKPQMTMSEKVKAGII